MLLHMDGFDSYATVNDLFQEYPLVNNCFLNLNTGRFGGASVAPTNGFGLIYYQGLTEIWAGMGFNGSSTGGSSAGPGTGSPVIAFGSSFGIEAEVILDPSFTYWSLYNGEIGGYPAPTMQGNVTYPISTTGWHWLDIHYQIGNNGILELYIDGSRILNLSNVNTTSSGSTFFNSVIFGGDIENNGAVTLIDDVYILDTTGEFNNNRLGSVRIESLVPASDAGPNNGNIIADYGFNYGLPGRYYPGPHYKMINEPQWSSANVVILSNTVGQEELYGMTQLVNTPDTIYAIKVTGVMEKSNSGQMLANTIISSNGIVNAGNSTILLSSYSHVNNIFETDPNTQNVWTYTSINNLNCGVIIS